MANMSAYQRSYWYPRIAEKQGGEFCNHCGAMLETLQKHDRKLIIDKINNDGNHTIEYNTIEDFQLLCKPCNKLKDPFKKTENLPKTQSEATNHRAEKPLMRWLFDLVHSGKTITYKWFVAEGSYKFDVSPKTIDNQWYTKYFESESGPFALEADELKGDIVILKKRDKPQEKQNDQSDPLKLYNN